MHEQHAASSHLKGKAQEVTQDLPPHMANYAGLLFDGKVLTSKTFNASPSSIIPEWRASPLSTLAITRLQEDKETCFDPIKRPERREPEAKSIPKPKDNQTKPPIPMLNNLRPAITPVQSTPQAFNLRPPAANTEDAFKNHHATSAKNKDIEMKEVNTKAKLTPAYHFTSDIQEMYNLDRIV